MANLKSLSKMRTASRLCKLGAGIITVLGLVAVALYMSTLVQVFASYRQDQGSPYIYISYGGVFSTMFLIIAPTLFFAIILYAVGTLMDFMGAETKHEQKPQERDEEGEVEIDDDRIQIVPLPADMR